MSLADRLASPPKRSKGPGCGVGTLIATLPASEKKALMKALLNSQLWLGTELAAELEAEGHKIAPNTISRHRRRECTCEDTP